MIATREDMPKYIPQREPMLLVHFLHEHSSEKSVSGFLVEENHVLVEDGRLSEAGLLENMAQTAALSKGFEYAQKNETPPVGFIGAVKSFEVNRLPSVGEQIETHLWIKHEVMNASIVDTKVFCQQEEIASCELKIFINPQLG